jgi:hypothetical protein
MNITDALHTRLAADATLAALLSEYGGEPAIFTTDPAPDDAVLPYIVSAGEVAQSPADTKNSRGREVMRDVRCYAADSGSATTVEAIAERVRTLLHRHELAISGGETIIAFCTGPVAADERDAYGRIVTVNLRVDENGG